MTGQYSLALGLFKGIFCFLLHTRRKHLLGYAAWLKGCGEGLCVPGPVGVVVIWMDPYITVSSLLCQAMCLFTRLIELVLCFHTKA